jgi:hypothetical protein
VPDHHNPGEKTRRFPYRRDVSALLMDAGEQRFIAIEPSGDGGYRLVSGAIDGETQRPSGEPERFDSAQIAAAVQRACVLAGTWLDFTEWEIEQVRGLFVEAGGGR